MKLVLKAPVIVLLIISFTISAHAQRLDQYSNASIGDALILNPILSADSASREIEGKVFEGLIDRDEDLSFRGRLATTWNIYEEAYFYINATADIPNLGRLSPQAIVELLQNFKQKENLSPPKLKQTVDNISSISLIPPHTYTLTKLNRTPSEGKKTIDIKISVSAPARDKLDLDEVDQDLFINLKHLLGDQYFSSFRGQQFLTTHSPIDKELLSFYARELLPAIEHNPVIVFNLRENVKFHDGHIFDAHDVKFTYEAIMDPKNLSPHIADYEPVKTVAVVDPLTVRIVYKRLYSLSFETWGMGILPEHLLNTTMLNDEALFLGMDPQTFSIRQSAFNRHPIGCGPFKFREWKSNRFITLDRFDDYWEGPPNFKKYVFRVIPDLLTQEMEFYAGNIDSYRVPGHQVKRLKADPRFQSFSGLSFGYTYIGYNMRRRPFDDRRVRQALSIAIDVNKIIEHVLYNQGERLTGPFVKQTDFYNPNIKPVPYDPEGALKLLAEAGWQRNAQGWLERNGKRLQFKLITNKGNDIRKSILTIAQDSWKQIGIDVRTDLVEWSVFIQERVSKMDFDALVLGWSMGIEPDLYKIWHSSQTNPNQLNFVSFKNKEADDLIAKIRQEYDHEQQVQYCYRLHEIIAYEQPYTFLYVDKWTAILDKRIVIKDVDPDGTARYSRIKPTKTGSYTFYFNKWIKLPQLRESLRE
jgi:ABC-type transport system substrate-binding protein